MGCAPSHEIHPYKRYPPTTNRYDWDAEEGGLIPHRFQGEHRKRWRREDRRAYEKKVRFERERSVRRYRDVDAKKAEFRRQYDARRRAREGEGGGRPEMVSF